MWFYHSLRIYWYDSEQHEHFFGGGILLSETEILLETKDILCTLKGMNTFDNHS